MTNDGMTFTSSGARPLFGSDMFSGILATSCDIALVVDPSGQIRHAVSGQESRLFKEAAAWPGQDLFALVDTESAEKLRAAIDDLSGQMSDDRGKYRWAELMHTPAGEDSFPVRYSLHPMADDDAVLLLGRDQRPVIEIQQQLLNAQVALERDYEAQREADTRYRLLMEFTTDAVALVAVGTGKIVDVNHNAALLLGKARADLIGAPLEAQFDNGEAADLMERLGTSGSGRFSDPIELTTAHGRTPVEIHPRLFRAAGQRLVFCRLADPGRAAPSIGPLASDLCQLYQRGSDAIVFTNKDGVIESASESFLNLTDSHSQAQVIGRSIGDFLARGAVDLKVLLENARRAGHLRNYATSLSTDFDAHIQVELSATWLQDRTDPKLALIIRDATSSTALRGDFALGEDSMRNVMELVGSSNLKDIVGETTNMVEKICIETAIELTRNNRVAAAEMLGLSRQSLYVKLRKYGLLSREEE